MKYSLAVAALLSLVSYSDVVSAINSKSSEDLRHKSNNEQQTDVYAEVGRFINSKGEPINLAQEKGHARLELTRIKKYEHPVDITDLQMLECDKLAK